MPGLFELLMIFAIIVKYQIEEIRHAFNGFWCNDKGNLLITLQIKNCLWVRLYLQNKEQHSNIIIYFTLVLKSLNGLQKIRFNCCYWL